MIFIAKEIYKTLTMRKINEQELENIIRDVINESLMLEGPDEGIGGGLKAAGKQIVGDIKNAWQNLKQAYKYGSQTQDKEKEIRKNINNPQSQEQPSDTTNPNNGGDNTTNNVTAQGGGNTTPKSTAAKPAAPKQTTPNNTQADPQQTAAAPQDNQGAGATQTNQNNGNNPQPKQQPTKKQQVKSTMRTAWSQQRRGFAKQFLERDVMRIGKNYDISPNELAGQLEAIAKTLRTNPQQYFPQTNESRLSDETMDRLTEEIVTRIKKG